MRLLVHLETFKVSFISEIPSYKPEDYVMVEVFLSPHVKILLSCPGVSYVGAPMIAEAQPNGIFNFTCDQRPFKFSDNRFWEQKWPWGGWHFLNVLNAIDLWFLKELPGTYLPMFKTTMFEIIDDFYSRQ